METNGATKNDSAVNRCVIIDNDGNTHVNLESISRVGIDNIFDLKSYTISRDGELTEHKIEINDGGIVKIVYTNRGKLEEFSGTRVGYTITKNDEIIIKQFGS